MSEKYKTSSPSFPSSDCYDCREIKRLDGRVRIIENKLNGLLTTTLTTLVLVIGVTIKWLL